MVALTVEVLGAPLVEGLDVGVEGLDVAVEGLDVAEAGLDAAGAGRAFGGPAGGLHKRNMVR